MKRVLRFSTIALASYALAAIQNSVLAQSGGIKFSDVAGTGRFEGDKMTGTWEARYASGDVARGKTDATRKK